MHVLSVVGARPQFVKLAPIAHVFAATQHEHIVVHTGQHYDVNLSDVFFEQLAVPHPHMNLGIGSGPHGAQTGAMLAAVEKALLQWRPDWVLVYGDTNSTLAGALASVKLHIAVAHLEAGLRSYNRRMPEEHNRVLTDHAADLLLAPSDVAMDNLAREGLGARSVLVGDVMTDVLYRVRDEVRRQPPQLPAPMDREGYVVATIHRAENTDDPSRLGALITALATIRAPVALLAHPRLVASGARHNVALNQGSISVLEPLDYRSTVAAVLGARGVVTDSGGLQKEALLLGVPCTTLRDETEWPETLQGGWNVVASELENIAELAVRPPPQEPRRTPYGDGHAAETVVHVLESC